MDNLNSLSPIIKNFMRDTYSISVDEFFEREEFREMLHRVMTGIHENNRNIPMSEKNKLVIINVRNMVFEKSKKQKKQMLPQGDITAPPSQPQNMDPPLPIPEMEDKDDDIFFKKLQELEQRRKIGLSHKQTPDPTPPIAIHAETPLNAQPVSQEHVIIAVPPPPRHGMSYIISSWDRKLPDNPERADFVWNSTLPTMIDPLGTRIAGLFLPISVSNYTPYIIISIEGASGISTSCILYPEAVHKNRGWGRWIPIHDSLSYIKNVSSPWTIQLRSADNTLLPLGRDATAINSISIDTANGSAMLTVTPVPHEGEFLVGDHIWIYTKKDRKKTEVISVSNGMIEVRYHAPAKSPSPIFGNSSHEWTNSYILNYTRQWSIVLDLTSSEHTKK